MLLYAVDEADPEKQAAARNWRAELWKTRRGRVSFQVLGEFYVNAVRKQPAAREEARAEVLDLLAWNPVVTDAALLGARVEAARPLPAFVLGCADRGGGQSGILPVLCSRKICRLGNNWMGSKW